MIKPTRMASAIALPLCLLAPSASHAQSDWTKLTFPQGPRGRSQMRAVTTPTRVLAFGGSGDFLSSVLFNDTWEWRGNTWKQLQPNASPSPRFGHAMAYDAARDRVVMFGGKSGGRVLGDTWEFDGATWQPVQNSGPSPREGARMAYDHARKVVVLFGGAVNTQALDDTWIYDGIAWKQVQTSSSATPAKRAHHAMAWDANTQRVVIASGLSYVFPVIDNDWAFDGSAWTRIPSSKVMVPPAEACWDEARRRVVLLEGSGVVRDWDGASWSVRSPKTTAPGYLYSALAYDPSARQVARLLGTLSGRYPQEAWTFKTNAIASATPFGSACRGSTGTASIEAANSLSWLGETTAFALTGARPKSPAILSIGLSDKLWSTMPLPYDMKPIGASGCFVYHSVEAFELATTDDKGNASVRIPVPNDPTLAGLSYFAQYYLPDQGANSFGMTTTQAIRSVVGIL